MRALLLVTFGVLIALLPGDAVAQDQRCHLLPGAREATRHVLPDGRSMVYVSGPAEFACPDGTTIVADSAIGETESGVLDLIGNVFYSDTLKTLTSDRLEYFREDGRLFARGNVVLTDRKTGSVITGAVLEHLLAGTWRPDAKTTVTGRPHAILYERSDSTPTPAGDEITVAADSTAQPVEIDADRMEIWAETLFRADGDVVLVRGETQGFGDHMEFDQVDGRMLLVGSARIEGDAFSLVARRIEGYLVEDVLRDVVAERDAVLLAEELRVEAPWLRIFFEEGELHRLVATRAIPGSEEANSTADPLPQPRAIATEFWLAADSIDALAPAERLELVVAVGEAYAERIADVLEEGLPDVVARDWLRGDTITGYFVQQPRRPPVGVDEPVTEEETLETVLERLVAVGEEGRARSLYRIREEGGEGDAESRASINYLVANRITLLMRHGEVEDVEADGPIQGLHLEPKKTRERQETLDERGESGEP